MKKIIATPKKSVFIVPSMIKDKSLAKMTKSRLTITYIYGFIRNTFNISLNNPNSYYSKQYHNIYCVEQIPTLMERSGLGRNSIVNAFKALNRCNYIHTVYDPHRHVNFIFLPKLTNELIKSGNLGVSLESKLSQFGKQTNVSLESKLRCSNQNSSNHNVATYNSKTPKNQKTNANHDKKMMNYINNYDYPVEVNHLLIYGFNYNKAHDLASAISNIKVEINKHYGIYSNKNMLFDNKTNPYIQHSSGLYRSLRNSINNKKDMITVISSDYEAFVKHYMATAQRNQHYATRKPLKRKLPRWARDDYHVKLHPTSPRLQAKVQKQLQDLKNHRKSSVK